METQAAAVSSPINLWKAAQEFAAEIAGTAERKKKAFPSPDGVQAFLLYVRTNGKVPAHQVTGPITVQTIVGDVDFTVQGTAHRLPAGSAILVAAGEPHALEAKQESVLLVTHALKA